MTPMKRPLIFRRAGALALVGGIAFACVGVHVAVAQDFRAAPIYGYLTLDASFEPDPVQLAIAAGGHVNARELGLPPGCIGFINPEAPQVKLNYTAGTTAMQVYAHSAADTTLIIRDPSGTWHCDDDSMARNPAIRFPSPKSGEYSIWVGAFGGGRPQADLYVTER